MKVIALLSQHGGAGTTTRARHRAVAAHARRATGDEGLVRPARWRGGRTRTAIGQYDLHVSPSSSRDPHPAPLPCRPAILDLRAIGTTIDLAKLANTPARVVLNAVPARGNLAHDAADAIDTYGIAIAPHHLGQRAAFQHALTLGLTAQEYEPRGKAAEEVQARATWTQQQVYVYTRRIVEP